MSLSFYLGRRLSLGSEGKRKAPAIRVAIIAVALSIAVMIGAIAIVTGFQREIRDRIIGFNSHITLYALSDPVNESNIVSLTPGLSQLLKGEDYISDIGVEAAIPAIMKTTEAFKGVYLKSAADSNTSSFLQSTLEEGALPSFMAKPKEDTDTASLEILISRKTANELNLRPGDKINTYFLNDELRVRPLRVKGIYNSHFNVYDNAYIYGDLRLIQQLGALQNTEGTAIRITTNDFSRLTEYSQRLQQRLIEGTAEGLIYRPYQVDNALNQGAGYFRWLTMLDTNVVVIIVLMTFVACVTLISAMLIIILDKKRFIGIIRALGASKRDVRSTFIWLALRIAVTGMLIGNLLMLCFLYAQKRYHFLPLDPDAYYIDYVPVHFSWEGFAILNAGVLFIIWLTLILPSLFAARISPAVTMRFE